MLNPLFGSTAVLPSPSRSMSAVFLTLGSHCATLWRKWLYEYLKHPHDKLLYFQSTEHATLHQLNAVLAFHTPFLSTPHLFLLSYTATLICDSPNILDSLISLYIWVYIFVQLLIRFSSRSHILINSYLLRHFKPDTVLDIIHKMHNLILVSSIQGMQTYFYFAEENWGPKHQFTHNLKHPLCNFYNIRNCFLNFSFQRRY